MDLKEIDYKERVINLFADIDEESTKEVIQKIVKINCSDAEYINSVVRTIGACGYGVDPNSISLPPIILNLSTLGGTCYDGFGLCDAIRTSDTSVDIVCFGKIMSMGIPVLLSAKRRAAHKNTIFMIHGMSCCLWGKTQNMKEQLDEADRLEAQMVDYIVTNSKFPKKKLQEIIASKKDYYFGVEEALKYKIITEIIE